MVLHLAIDHARHWVNDGLMSEDEAHRSLPAHRDDCDRDTCIDFFFQDRDVLLLFEARFDGIEDPDCELNQFAGIGDLRPANWFTPFLNVEPRDPDRGFRR